ncbi:MAG TPA: SpoIIE family protein phosphatase [Pirellulales bacterium]|jgi:serine phosphatase RsbU (regulator of sigma subunit)|nr:SpoIIE family protein phosphatase [Pirellulales bacterium]
MLEILNGAAAGQRYELASGQTVLGRDPFCDVILPLRSISRQHARILAERGQFYIEDLHSLNGTFVNGQRVAARARLKDHDRIQLYETQITFYETRPEPDDSSGSDAHALEDAAPAGAVSASSTSAPAARPGAVRSGTAAAGAVVAKLEKSSPAAVVEQEAGGRTTMVVNVSDAEARLGQEVGAQARLQAVLEIIHNLGRSLDAAVFLPNILDSLFEIFPQAERGYVLLVNPADGQLMPQAIKHRRGEPGSSLTFGPISRTVANRVMTAGEAILSTDADKGDNSSILDSGNASTMTVPLMGPSRQPLGLLHLEATDRERRFVRADLEVLWSVGTVTGQAVEFARVHEARLTFDRRQRELDTAREVQLHFLPHARPEVPGYCFFDYYQAAEDVGGDYFGYIRLADGRLAIAVGDVSGKGVSAALLMARLCSEVRYCLAICPSVVEAVERLNLELSGTTQNDRFVTFLLCVLDPVRHVLEVVNAGHPSPLRRRGEVVEKLGLEEAGPPLGLDLARRYTSFTTEIAESDAIVLYTDGISEARSPRDIIYGSRRLVRRLSTGPDNAIELGQHLLSDVERFAHGRPQSDDICVVTFGRLPKQ